MIMARFCPICRDTRKVNLSVFEQPTAAGWDDGPLRSSVPRAMFETFDCPRCIPSVPYRRVRAKKVVSKVDFVDYGKFQVPIQRQLAAKFGEYLMREGLIWFTTDKVEDLDAITVEVSARCNVVDRTGGEIAGAEKRMEVAEADVKSPAKIINQIARRRDGQSMREVNVTYIPDADVEEIFKPEAGRKRLSRREVLREEREKAEAMDNRFSGLELDYDE